MICLSGSVTKIKTQNSIDQRHKSDNSPQSCWKLNPNDEEAFNVRNYNCRQLAETRIPVFMEDVKEWGIEALHRAIAGLSCLTAVHICYGYGIEENLRWKDTLGSEWRQYEEIFPALNVSHIDQISLECADSRVPLSLLGLLKNKDLMVGVVAVTRDRVESPDQVAGNIRAAMAYVDAERLYPCTNCGMVPIPYDMALGKIHSLAAGAYLVRKTL